MPAGFVGHFDEAFCDRYFSANATATAVAGIDACKFNLRAMVAAICVFFGCLVTVFYCLDICYILEAIKSLGAGH